jgi:hypothetical protein
MTTITSAPVYTPIPVYTWMLTYTDAALGFVEKRYLLAGHMLGIYMYGPGKRGPEDEWRRVQTFVHDSPEDAHHHALILTELDEKTGHSMFGPVVATEMVVYHAIWENAAASDPSGTRNALAFVQKVLYKVQASGTELG